MYITIIAVLTGTVNMYQHGKVQSLSTIRLNTRKYVASQKYTCLNKNLALAFAPKYVTKILYNTGVYIVTKSAKTVLLGTTFLAKKFDLKG